MQTPAHQNSWPPRAEHALLLKILSRVLNSMHKFGMHWARTGMFNLIQGAYSSATCSTRVYKCAPSRWLWHWVSATNPPLAYIKLHACKERSTGAGHSPRPLLYSCVLLKPRICARGSIFTLLWPLLFACESILALLKLVEDFAQCGTSPGIICDNFSFIYNCLFVLNSFCY